MTLFDISLPRITLSAIEVQVSRIPDGFSVKHTLTEWQLKEVTGSDVKDADTLTKILEDIDRTGKKLRIICTSQVHILR